MHAPGVKVRNVSLVSPHNVLDEPVLQEFHHIDGHRHFISLKPTLEIHHRLRESLVFRLVIDEIRILIRLQQTLLLIGCLERIL